MCSIFEKSVNISEKCHSPFTPNFEVTPLCAHVHEFIIELIYNVHFFQKQNTINCKIIKYSEISCCINQSCILFVNEVKVQIDTLY